MSEDNRRGSRGPLYTHTPEGDVRRPTAREGVSYRVVTWTSGLTFGHRPFYSGTRKSGQYGCRSRRRRDFPYCQSGVTYTGRLSW